jgi:hypothetical protein
MLSEAAQHTLQKRSPSSARINTCRRGGRLQVTIGGVPIATNVRGDGIGEIALLYGVGCRAPPR